MVFIGEIWVEIFDWELYIDVNIWIGLRYNLSYKNVK